jgi:hypothetical protein
VGDISELVMKMDINPTDDYEKAPAVAAEISPQALPVGGDVYGDGDGVQIDGGSQCQTSTVGCSTC